MVVGCLIALATRPYVGWFLAAAAALVCLHAGLTRLHGLRALTVTVGMVAVIAAFVPIFLQKSSHESLQNLQTSQNANAADTKSNLSLERVDYSSRGKIIVNLPKRIADVITRPYLWQAQNASQQLGVIGTLVVLAALFLLFRAVIRNGRAIMRRAGPLVYPGFLMLCAYALSAGNAGTAFRYRTHIMAIALALIVVLREHGRDEQQVAEIPEIPRWQNAGATPTLAQ
jgi:O-antigen ligase